MLSRSLVSWLARQSVDGIPMNMFTYFQSAISNSALNEKGNNLEISCVWRQTSYSIITHRDSIPASVSVPLSPTFPPTQRITSLIHHITHPSIHHPSVFHVHRPLINSGDLPQTPDLPQRKTQTYLLGQTPLNRGMWRFYDMQQGPPSPAHPIMQRTVNIECNAHSRHTNLHSIVRSLTSKVDLEPPQWRRRPLHQLISDIWW